MDPTMTNIPRATDLRLCIKGARFKVLMKALGSRQRSERERSDEADVRDRSENMRTALTCK